MTTPLIIPPRSAVEPRQHVPAWQRPIRAFVWAFDFCDGSGDPSMAKGIAAALALATLYDIARHGIHAGTIALAALVMSAAFGRSMFMHWLDHNEWKHTLDAKVATNVNTNVDVKADLAPVIQAAADRMSLHSPHGAE